MRAKGFAYVGCAAILAAGLAAQADEKSDALIKAARQKATQAKTLQADLEIAAGASASFKGTVRLMKPGYGNLTVTGPQGEMIIASDGENIYQVSPAQKRYLKAEAQGRAAQLLGGAPGSPITAFLAPDTFAAGGTHRFGGTKKVGEVTYQVIEITAEQPPQKQKLFIGPSGIAEGVELGNPADPAQSMTMWLKNVRLDVPMKAEQFAYTPPADFETQKSPEDSLLAVGKMAPDFMLPQPGGGQLALEQARKGKKAVLINFWFHG